MGIIAHQGSLFGEPPQSANKAKEKVEHVLSLYPYTRGNDMELFLQIWTIFDGLSEVLSAEDYKRFVEWFRSVATTPETMRRARQGMQEHGQYLPPESVYQARHKMAEEYRRYFGNDDEDTYG